MQGRGRDGETRVGPRRWEPKMGGEGARAAKRMGWPAARTGWGAAPGGQARARPRPGGPGRPAGIASATYRARRG